MAGPAFPVLGDLRQWLGQRLAGWSARARVSELFPVRTSALAMIHQCARAPGPPAPTSTEPTPRASASMSARPPELDEERSVFAALNAVA